MKTVQNHLIGFRSEGTHMTSLFKRAMKLKLLGLCTAFAMCAAAPCQATTVYVEYSGTIFGGADHVGLFGTPHSNMAGQSYTASYVF